MSRNEQLKKLISDMEPDLEKFYEKGNKAAGTRARKQLQELRKLSQEIRLEIQDIKNKEDRKSTRLNSSHVAISYAVFCLKKKRGRERTLRQEGHTTTQQRR